MTREQYADYLALFNSRDERFVRYYDPAIVFDHGDTGGLLRGPEAIAKFYRNVWKEIKETLSVGEVVIDNCNGVMAVELTTDLVAMADVAGVPGIHMKRGDHLNLKEMVLYGLSHGKIVSVRAPVTGRTFEKAEPNAAEK